ncbi:Ku protein [Rhizobium sp.]|uniref:non-homologous end joining protein Ku n=1 Tax=Rhizobium sp. TaxID=391 RepID=UPI0028A8333D
MPLRPYWKGYLKLSLVTCSVEMTPATSDSEKIKFHTLNRETNNRVLSQYVDSITGKTVREQDEVKGYQRAEDDYVILEDDDLEHVALESTKTIDISTFTPREEIDWIWLDKPYYLTPNDKVSVEAFAVIRAAMDSQKMVGISRLVLGRRERAVMLEPRGKGIVLWTLRYGDEVREAKDYFDGLSKAKPEKEALPLVRKLIKKQTRHWDAAMVSDPVQDNLLDIIKSKKKRRKPTATKTSEPEEVEKPSNVINIMDALRKSVEADNRRSKTK